MERMEKAPVFHCFPNLFQGNFCPLQVLFFMSETRWCEKSDTSLKLKIWAMLLLFSPTKRAMLFLLWLEKPNMVARQPNYSVGDMEAKKGQTGRHI